MKHIVGFSGGIDSQTALRYARNRYGDDNVVALNSQAGRWEHELTTEYVTRYSREVFPITEVVPLVSDIWETDSWAETHHGLDGSQELTMELLISIKKRPPSRKAKFCTEILKMRPQRRWIREKFGPTGEYAGEDYCRHIGVRREESESRKKTPFVQWDDFFDCELYCDIADWTKQMCFDYVRQYGEPVNQLYSMGFDRVGCMPCVDSDKEDILNMSIRAPHHVDKVAAVEQRTGKTFFMPMFRSEPNTIQQVVEWSRTDYGGRQFNILNTLERPACESKYGLCE